ncbi:hypothetical protein FKW77_008507 [Venturia effusa]|uniref:Uncharacterized protein n=1 Tax=Venturia effusa TaxID=50376 RepID=A0A517KX07_9PEZI|nr:hypothetical protein FKW77_008507 [Venturia effusa]
MSLNDMGGLPEARLSSKQTQPISLTVRNPNIIQPPQRTSSLKSSPVVRSARRKTFRVQESETIVQPKKLEQRHQIAPGSLLKVAKTRPGTENATSSQHSKETILGKLPNVSVHSLLSEDFGWWRGSELGILRGNSFRSHALNASPKLLSRSKADKECISHSRSSTAMSHSTDSSIPHQLHHRRDSVRRTVTKVFSTLNRRKKTGRSERTKSSPEPETGWHASVPTLTSTVHAKNERNSLDVRDSGVFLMDDTAYLPAFDGAQDTDDPRTANHQSPEKGNSPSYNSSPPNSFSASSIRSQDFQESSEGLFPRSKRSQHSSPQFGYQPRLVVRERSQPPTLRVRLTTKAELREANLTSEDTIWALIQVHGEVTGIGSQPCDAEIETSIAIAVILDNSCLSTMKDIEKAILEIIGLAGQFQPHLDRLGVYCTAFSTLSTDESPDCCVISLSQPLDRERLSKRLRCVAKQSQHGYHLEAALSQATQALRELDDMQAPAVRRDIIVISPNPVGLAGYTESLDESVSIHIFNPGLVPFGSLDDYGHPRSQLDTLSNEGRWYGTYAADKEHYVEGTNRAGWVIDATTCVSRGCNIHGSHSLSDVVAHAKAQTNTGSITTVSISITPGTDVSSIVEVVGKLEYSMLRPGQIISIPIKVQLKSLACRLSHVPFALTPRRSVTEAITDLELTLGEHLNELFQVQVRYSHTMFPENTTLVAQESCWLRRTLTHRVARGDDARRETVYECMVQRQLALSLASHRPPTDALNALEQEFDSKPVPPYCSKFVEAVKDRLRHRIDRSLYRPRSVVDAEDDSYVAHLQEFVDERERQELDTEHSPATVVRRRIVHTPDMELHDTARRIWQHIRKTSKSEREMCNEMEPSEVRTQVSDARMEQIRKMALKNRRKMSTETLKSLALDYSRFSAELGGVDELSSDDVD